MVDGNDPDDETVVPYFQRPNRPTSAEGDFAPPHESLVLVRLFARISSPTDRQQVIEFAQSVLSGQK